MVKLVVSDKNGKSISKDIDDRSAQSFIGSRIGDTIDSSIIGIINGKLKITGGSDKAGTPMRGDVHGGVKKYVLLAKGVGMKNIIDGNRIRKLVRGNMVTEDIYQINCSLLDGEINKESEESQDSKQ